MDVFLYDRSHRNERVKNLELLGRCSSRFLKENCWLYKWILPRVFRFHELNIGVFRTLSNIYERFFPKKQLPLRKKCLYSELFCSVFCGIRTEYEKIRTKITPNMDTHNVPPPFFLTFREELLRKRGGCDFFRGRLQFSQKK